MQALVLGFCSSGYDFAIASSRHHLTVITLQVAMRFVGNYALRGLSPQTDGMPVIHKKRLEFLTFLIATTHLLSFVFFLFSLCFVSFFGLFLLPLKVSTSLLSLSKFYLALHHLVQLQYP